MQMALLAVLWRMNSTYRATLPMKDWNVSDDWEGSSVLWFLLILPCNEAQDAQNAQNVSWQKRQWAHDVSQYDNTAAQGYTEIRLL